MDPTTTAETPVWGLRCTDPDPIGHEYGRVYGAGIPRHRLTSLAVGNRCYELVVSHDGGITWEPETSDGAE